MWGGGGGNSYIKSRNFIVATYNIIIRLHVTQQIMACSSMGALELGVWPSCFTSLLVLL